MKQADRTDKPSPRKSSKKDWLQSTIKAITERIAKGENPEKVIESLSLKQYDALIDSGFDPDSLLLTPEQLQTVQQVRRSPRPSGLVYKKTYAPDRQAVYTALVEQVKLIGGIPHDKEKENYRQLDFTLNGKHYRLVLSMPREKREA